MRPLPLAISLFFLSSLATVDGCRSGGGERIAEAPAVYAPQSPAPAAAQPPATVSGPPAAADGPALSATAVPQPAPAIPQPAPGPLTLAGAIRTALDRNPDLVAIRQDEGVSLAALDVARTFPYNPTLSVDIRPYTREEDGKRDETLVAATLLEEFEIAGQWRHRREAGEAEVDAARWKILDAEMKVAATTARLYFTALYRRQVREADEAYARLKEDLLQVVERLFAAGLATATDATLGRLEARSARVAAELGRMRDGAALHELWKQMGIAGEAAPRPGGALEDWSWPPAPGETDAPSRPDVRAAEAGARASSAQADLAASSRIPNVTAGPVFEKDETGTIFVGLEAQLPIPVLNTGSALARQRRAERDRGAEAARQAGLKARAEVEASRALYEEARRLVEGLRGPAGLEDEVRRVRDQYEAGQVDIVKVYLAEADLLAARRTALDARYELALAAVDLTAAAALPPEVLLVPRPASRPPENEKKQP